MYMDIYDIQTYMNICHIWIYRHIDQHTSNSCLAFTEEGERMASERGKLWILSQFKIFYALKICQHGPAKWLRR